VSDSNSRVGLMRRSRLAGLKMRQYFAQTWPAWKKQAVSMNWILKHYCSQFDRSKPFLPWGVSFWGDLVSEAGRKRTPPNARYKILVIRLLTFRVFVQSVILISLRVLQCVEVCCSVLQCVAVCCSVLQCVTVCCTDVLQRVLVCYGVMICLHSYIQV